MGRPLEGEQKVDRYKIGDGSNPNLKVKQTSPGVKVVKMPKATPSRPQAKEFMGVGGSPGKAKGRTCPKEANARDPGATPYGSTKINYLTPDKSARKGFRKGRGWPEGDTGGAPEVKISDPLPSRKA